LPNLWEEQFEPYEKGKHGSYTQEEIGKIGGFKQETVALIRPIYPRLKYLHVNNFSNHDLVQLARIENDRLREALVNYAQHLLSSELQEKATTLSILKKTFSLQFANKEWVPYFLMVSSVI